ncbi:MULTISPECIES: glutamate--tRNA ligase [unclassified Paenibacillus]|uniref:glutamate--tRNA ligase n=1 Tax=unclassified Paenibacillus TaxID=185978 RepID=UPI001AE28616|nr:MULTISPECIES: glutamate--tRNA ligase [unclassified Paenibacillus]MBP1153532.1 nondiscriminating glutamyl-tRNA synthetase [Paenibacillus sp. PvP091]MBP1171083.1 nondiscriminating glutamyl-tRNA synthetase [Paenibacillus sp. PvR098]MBP2442111.1 nondiscriminating glutamyl-tRNA synthetase [Paenibacillus sp. PvP052]
MSQFRVRYAPSPTGHLHIGGARTALFNYLIARKQGGQFVIRFEDTDQTRHVETGVDSQLNGLKWLGVDWDESVDVGGPHGPYRQTERLGLYQPFIDQLLEQGNAYPCYCSEAELEEERAKQEAASQMPMYSGKCRQLTPEQAEAYTAEGRKPSIRFRVPENKAIAFDDRIRERVEFDTNGIGDFIIVRPDGIPTYNFAVILDDHLMGITLVIRGEEHLTNTPRQIMMYEALGLPVPEFAHLALILNQDRKKMSKRDESIIQFIEQYKELGYLPEAVMNFIALLGWSPKGEEEIFTKEELIAGFDLDRLSKSPAVFDMDKLNWMNNVYIKKADTERIVGLALPLLQKAGKLPQELTGEQEQWAHSLVGLYQEQLRYAAEIVDLSELFFREDVSYDEEAKAMLAEEHAPLVLRSFLTQVEQAAEFHVDALKAMLKAVQTETGYKGKPLFMTVRVALTGQMHGPDLNMTLHLLGKETVIRRIKKLL